MKKGDEVRKIIDLLEAGKIDAEQAERLMNTLKNKDKPIKKTRKLGILIMEESSAKPMLNIKIPLSFAKFGAKFIPKNIEAKSSIGGTNFDFNSIDWKEILQMANEQEKGELFYMEAEDNGKNIIIKIYVE